MAVGNLEFIKSATGSSVSSLSVTDCFNSDYDVYKITYIITDKLTTSDDLSLRLIDSGGSVISASEYDRANLNLTAFQAFGEAKSTGTTSFFSHTELTTSNDNAGAISYIFNPYDSSSYTFHTAQTTGFKSGGFLGKKIIGVHKSAEQITGINYFADSGTFSATLSVYGLASN